MLSLAGIPTLIVLDPQGEVITRQGRVEVLNDEDCREFPWHPKPVLELSDSNAVQLNEGPCLVLFVGMVLSGFPGVGCWIGWSPRGRGLCLRFSKHEPGPLCLHCSLVDPSDLFMALLGWEVFLELLEAADASYPLGRIGQAKRMPSAIN